MRKLQLTAVITLAIMLVSAAAWAFPPFLKAFTSTYKVKPDSALGKASCGICHVAKNKTDKLNPYGQDLKKAAKGAKVTAAVLAKVEKLDSDKDKSSNIKEIKAGKLPGDRKSK